MQRSSKRSLNSNLKGMKNLVIDLQNNGGGLLWSAKNISDELLSEDKLIVYSEGRAQPRRDLNAGDHFKQRSLGRREISRLN